MADKDGSQSPDDAEGDSANEGAADSKTCIECRALKHSTEVRHQAL